MNAQPSPTITAAAFLIVFSVSVCFSGHDIDLQLGVAGSGKNPMDNTLSEFAPVFSLQYRGAIPLSPAFSVLLSEEAAGIYRSSPSLPHPEYNYPVNYVSSAGLQYSGFGLVQVKGFSHFLPQSKRINFPIAREDIASPFQEYWMAQRMKSGADVFVDMPLWRFRITADLLYADLTFDMSHDTGMQVQQTLTQAGQQDADAWVDATASFEMLRQHLWIQSSVLMKNDLNAFKGYNYIAYYAGIEGNEKVFKNSLLISGDILSRYYDCEVMRWKGYGDRLGAIEHVRGIQRLWTELYVKGDLALEQAVDLPMRKFRGEVSMRKAWKNKSSVEAGLWLTGGVLFPRACAFASSTIAITARNAAVPEARLYYQALNDQYEFYRTDVGLAFRHDLSSTNPLLKNLSLDCGVQYRWIRNILYFQNSLDVFVGMSNWL
jgi:hypothetical protein